MIDNKIGKMQKTIIQQLNKWKVKIVFIRSIHPFDF